ncbi:MAG: hypothetical protein HY064_10600 [Bacteroidetes bacterium]|nr:hypothetical protein [Bacteroidota bacterium]
MYTFIRTVYFLWIAAAAPLGLYYINQYYPGNYDSFPVIVRFLSFCGLFMWAIYYLLFRQRYFPFDTLHAAGLLFFSVIGATAAFFSGTGQLLFSSYTVLFSSSLSLIFYFAPMCVFFLVPSQRGKWYFYKNAGYFFLPLIFFLTILAFLIIITGPALDHFRTGFSTRWKIIYFTAIGIDSVYSARSYFMHNMFVYDKGSERNERDQMMVSWGWFAVLSLIAVVALCMYMLATGMGAGAKGNAGILSNFNSP